MSSKIAAHVSFWFSRCQSAGEQHIIIQNSTLDKSSIVDWIWAQWTVRPIKEMTLDVYLKNFRNLNSTHLKYFLHILQYCNARWNLHFVVKVHKDINKFVVFDNCKGPMTMHYPECKFHSKFLWGICRALCKCGDGVGTKCKHPTIACFSMVN